MLAQLSGFILQLLQIEPPLHQLLALSQLLESGTGLLQLRLELPRPDARARAALYRRMLTGEAPLAGDVDLGALARGHRMRIRRRGKSQRW